MYPKAVFDSPQPLVPLTSSSIMSNSGGSLSSSLGPALKKPNNPRIKISKTSGKGKNVWVYDLRVHMFVKQTPGIP